jgi:hypothetical protein
MHATAWSLVAAFLAVGLEYTYRTMPAPWTSLYHFTVFALAQVFIGIAIYKIVTVPGVSLIGSFIVWATATIVARVFVSSVVLNDPVPNGTWVAVALLVCARIAQAVWK